MTTVCTGMGGTGTGTGTGMGTTLTRSRLCPGEPGDAPEAYRCA